MIKRPLGVAFLVFLLFNDFIAGGRKLSLPGAVLVFLFSMADLFFSSASFSLKKKYLIIYLLPLFLSLFQLKAALDLKAAGKLYHDKETLIICGRVSSTSLKGDMKKLNVACHEGHSGLKIGILIYTNKDIKAGDIIEAKGQIRLPNLPSNEGEFDEKGYLLSQGLTYKMIEPDIRIKGRIFCPTRFFEMIRTRLSLIYKRELPGEEGSVMSAMAVGEKDVDNDVNRIFQMAGIVAILSISGTHISVISKRCYRLLRNKGLSFFKAGIFSLLISFFYTEISGHPLSAVRAFILFIFFCAANCLGAKNDGITGLSTAGFISMFMRPFELKNPGFIFSYGFAFLIFIFSSYEDEFLKEKLLYYETKIRGKRGRKKDLEIMASRKLLIPFLTTLVLTISALPLMAIINYEIPVFSALINFILLPLFPVLLLSGLLGGLLSLIHMPFLPIIPFKICHFIIYLYESISDNSTRFPFSMVTTGNKSIIFIIFYYIFLYIIIRFIPYRLAEKDLKKCLLIQGLALPLLFLSIIITPNRKSEIDMLSVGQGDGIYMCLGKNRDIFIDGGSSSRNEIGNYVIGPFLKYKGVKKIDIWFVSHPDKDHISGLLELMQTGYPVKEIVTSESIGNTEEFDKIRNMATLNGTKIHLVNAGDCFDMGDSKIIVISPDRGEFNNDINDLSLCLLVENEGMKTLFTGDISAEKEKEILDRLGKVDILKACHHGSDGSNSEEFLKTLSPDIVLISAGKGNCYGHPGEKALKRMKKEGKIFCTIDSGRIRIRKGRIQTYY